MFTKIFNHTPPFMQTPILVGGLCITGGYFILYNYEKLRL